MEVEENEVNNKNINQTKEQTNNDLKEPAFNLPVEELLEYQLDKVSISTQSNNTTTPTTSSKKIQLM